MTQRKVRIGRKGERAKDWTTPRPAKLEQAYNIDKYYTIIKYLYSARIRYDYIYIYISSYLLKYKHNFYKI